MRWRLLRDRLRALLRSQRVRDEMDEEMQFHVDMRARELARGGMSPGDALAEARRTFGSTTRIKEMSYDVRGGGALEAIARDLAYAVRALRKQPLLSAVVIAVVAVGVGANAAILGVADHVFWRKLPVRDPEQLVQLRISDELPAFSYQMVRTLGASSAFSQMAARWRQSSTFAVGETTERRVVELVSGSYFDLLGIVPRVGRLLSAADDRTVMGHPVAVISDRYWRHRFNADPSVVGRVIRIDDYPLTVIGVAPVGFSGVEVGIATDAWVPLAMHPVLFSAHRSLVDDPWMWLDVLARVGPGSSRASARSRALAALQTYAKEAGWPADNPFTSHGIDLLPADRGMSSIREALGTPVTLLIGVAGLVLLIACANVATLLAVRSMARRKEIGVRLAMGASRARVMRQLSIESLLLAVGGGVLGTMLALRGGEVLLDLLPTASVPAEVDLTPDLRALAISLGVSIVAALLFGVAPALTAARVDVASVIRDEVKLHRVSRWKFSARRTVVAMQIALSVVLVVCAGLFARTLGKLAAAPTGFDAEHVVMATIEPSQNRHTPASARTFYHALEDRLRATPGVQAVGSSLIPLLGGPETYVFRSMRAQGMPRPQDGATLLSHVVDGDFFAATGLRMARGRALNASDDAAAPLVAVLNESAVRKYFHDADPIGRAVKVGPQQSLTVVGIVRDAKYRTLRESPPPTIYTTFEQDTGMVNGLDRTVYVRASGDPTRLENTVRAAARALDAATPITSIRTLSDQKRRAMASERVIAQLSMLAGGIALLLATIGLYGLIAFDLERRTREIGVRMSLGASRRAIAMMVMRGATVMVLVGLTTGLLASRGLSRFVASQLYGVTPSDRPVMVVACASLTVVAALATLVPALRATKINPVEALRCE